MKDFIYITSGNDITVNLKDGTVLDGYIGRNYIGISSDLNRSIFYYIGIIPENIYHKKDNNAIWSWILRYCPEYNLTFDPDCDFPTCIEDNIYSKRQQIRFLIEALNKYYKSINDIINIQEL